MLKLQALIVGVVVATGLAQPSRAQTYPSQNITVLVAFPAGGLADTIARLVSTKLEARLKQSVVVENHGGAGGNIAAKTVFTAAPDGYTLLATTTGLAVNMTACPKVEGFLFETTVVVVDCFATFCVSGPEVLVLKLVSPL